MKATEIDDITIHKAHCSWIMKQVKGLKSLFYYNSEDVIVQNKTKALEAIQIIEDSLKELKLYIESLSQN